MEKRSAGRPVLEDKRIKKQTHLKPKDSDTLKKLAESEGLTESMMIEKILVRTLTRHAKKL